MEQGNLVRDINKRKQVLKLIEKWLDELENKQNIREEEQGINCYEKN